MVESMRSRRWRRNNSNNDKDALSVSCACVVPITVCIKWCPLTWEIKKLNQLLYYPILAIHMVVPYYTYDGTKERLTVTLFAFGGNLLRLAGGSALGDERAASLSLLGQPLGHKLLVGSGFLLGTKDRVELLGLAGTLALEGERGH